MSVKYAVVTHATFSTSGKARTNPYSHGYGRKIPTRYVVSIEGVARPRKVWAMCYSNVASFYVIVNGEELFIHDHDLTEAELAS